MARRRASHRVGSSLHLRVCCVTKTNIHACVYHTMGRRTPHRHVALALFISPYFSFVSRCCAAAVIVLPLVDTSSALSAMILKVPGVVVLALAAPVSSFVAPRPQSFVKSNTSLKMSSTESFALNPSETAVVFIEYQNDFTTEGGKLYGAVKDCMDATGTLQNSKKVMDAARSAGAAIIHCPISFERGHKEISATPYGILAGVKEGAAFQAGEWGAQICDLMKPQEGDMIVKGKSGLCGFHSTNLDFLLRQNNIKNVVLAGFLTNCCVESSMRTAYEHGYKVYTLKDCCAATSVAGQEAAYEHTFGMFSIPTTSDQLIASMASPVSVYERGTFH